MLAKAQAKVPAEAGVWSYEPKWDGFRALVFRDGDEVVLLSRSGKDLGRYFPELLGRAARRAGAALCARRRGRCSPGDRRPDPAGLGVAEPTHPSRRSRVKMLSEQTPAHFIGFDALADRRHVAAQRAVPGPPQGALRCGEREDVVPRHPHDRGPRAGRAVARQFEGAGLDGVIAKRLDGPYLPGKREMVKVKHARDADCVAIGYRIHKSGEGVGSILLGLYRDDGELQMVGGAASFSAKDRVKLLADLEPLREGDRSTTASPAGGTRRPTSAGFPCGRKRSARSPTTRWKETPCTATVPACREIRALASRP